MPKKTKRKMSDDAIVKNLLTCFYLYNGYPVGSRGPAGLIMDVIRDLRPDVWESIREVDAHETYQKFFADPEDSV